MLEGDGDYFFGHELYNDRRQLSEHFHTIVMPIIGRWEFNYLLRAKINCQPIPNPFLTCSELFYEEFVQDDSTS